MSGVSTSAVKGRPMKRREFMVGAVTGIAGAAAVGVAGGVSFSRTPAAPPAEGRRSFSQQGEDLIIYDLLHGLMKVDKPVYLELGSADPVGANNTYLLYCTGGHGVLVEPNPYYVARLKQRRPNDTVVAVGVGVDDATEADYFVIRDRPMLNTFSRDQVAMLQKGRTDDVVEKTMKVPLISVNHLIETYLGGKSPDLLAIDVEGLDLAILRTLDFKKYRPGAICAETILMGSNQVAPDIANLLQGQGYVVRGATLYNTIFADASRYS
jgi:FkbM family methyltransferase